MIRHRGPRIRKGTDCPALYPEKDVTARHLGTSATNSVTRDWGASFAVAAGACLLTIPGADPGAGTATTLTRNPRLCRTARALAELSPSTPGTSTGSGLLFEGGASRTAAAIIPSRMLTTRESRAAVRRRAGGFMFRRGLRRGATRVR